MRCGLFNGFDLGTNKGLIRAKHLIDTWKPRVVHGSPPCTYHSTVQTANQRTAIVASQSLGFTELFAGDVGDLPSVRIEYAAA